MKSVDDERHDARGDVFTLNNGADYGDGSSNKPGPNRRSQATDPVRFPGLDTD